MATYCEICRTDFDDKPTCGCAVVQVELTGEQAAALALFLKRALFDDFKAKCAQSEGEAMAYSMRDASEKVRKALADSGHAPR
jgi:hypothetical protein